jgi:hypothetical protein
MLLSETTTITAQATGTSSGGQDVQASDSAVTTVLSPDIGLTSSADPPVLFAYGRVELTYRVANTGDTALSQVSVKDDSGNGSEYTACSGLSLGPGAQTTCTHALYLSPPAQGQTIDIVATARGVDPRGTTVSKQTTTQLSREISIYLPQVVKQYY